MAGATPGAAPEATAPRASGLVVRELSPIVSNWRSRMSVHDYLTKHGIPGIQEVDTRAITKKLRVDGAMKCCLSTLPISEAEAERRMIALKLRSKAMSSRRSTMHSTPE